MLLSIQFPLADARKFLQHSQQLKIPAWPFPNSNNEFIRFFGSIRDRRLGGLDGWVGEDRICKSDRALVFLKNPTLITGKAKNLIAFRRLYFDGWAVGKFEIGIHAQKSAPMFWSHSAIRIKDLENYFLRLQVRVGRSSAVPITCELAQAGKHLAQLYLRATTPTNISIAETDKWQVWSGEPLLFMELSNDENISNLRGARFIELPDWFQGVRLFHHSVNYRGGNVHMWILRIESGKENIARTLRLFLLRLHAEHECLRLILQSMVKGNIDVTGKTKQSDDLQTYLHKSIRRIAIFETRTDKLNEKIAKIARQSINVIKPGQLDILLEGIDDNKRQLRRHLESYALQDATIVNYGYMEVHRVENKQGNTYHFENFQAGILNIQSTLTDVSQNISSLPNVSTAVRDELKQLFEQLNITLQKAPPEKVEDAEAIAETAKDLVKDLSKEKPNKVKIQITLAGLKQAAENLAKVIPDLLPIAIQIIGNINKSIGAG